MYYKISRNVYTKLDVLAPGVPGVPLYKGTASNTNNILFNVSVTSNQ